MLIGKSQAVPAFPVGLIHAGHSQVREVLKLGEGAQDPAASPPAPGPHCWVSDQVTSSGRVVSALLPLLSPKMLLHSLSRTVCTQQHPGCATGG